MKIAVDFSGTSYSLSDLARILWQNVSDKEKLKRNLRDPFGEWLHTSHVFSQQSDGTYLGEHYFLGELTTIDILTLDPTGSYFGKAQLNNNKFRLVQRHCINSGNIYND